MDSTPKITLVADGCRTFIDCINVGCGTGRHHDDEDPSYPGDHVIADAFIFFFIAAIRNEKGTTQGEHAGKQHARPGVVEVTDGGLVRPGHQPHQPRQQQPTPPDELAQREVR